jgi:DNA-binding beta-propeller fold protein YncE
MNHSQQSITRSSALVIGSMFVVGCTGSSAPDNLANRAYIVSLESDELTVIDLDRLEIIGQVPTGGLANHMAELSADFSKVYIDSSETDQTIVVDARALAVTSRITTGGHPTHLGLSRDGGVLAVMNEDDDSISFIDPVRDVEIKRLGGFYTPHMMRFSPDGRHGYVANIGAFHLSRVDLATLEIDRHIALDGYAGPPNVTLAVGETGFADAQIDPDGTLYAAHNATARVLVYDTVAEEKRTEIAVDPRPWIAFAEHPFAQLPRRQIVPAFGDRTMSLIRTPTDVQSLPGDAESYGVNFTSRAPDKAFVMSRTQRDIAVVDTARGEVTARIPVGGNTETASTTADGRLIVATVSGANRVVVIDAVTNEIVKTFDNVGKYPWSVTIPLGQNYCH